MIVAIPSAGAACSCSGLTRTCLQTHPTSRPAPRTPVCFDFGPQRAGDYVVVALAPGSATPQWHQHERLTALRNSGERITLSGESDITVDLTALRK